MATCFRETVAISAFSFGAVVIYLAWSFNLCIKIPFMKRFYFLLLSAFFSVMAFAQDAGTTKVDVNLDTDNNAAGFPWLWVVGGIVFVLLLVALLSGGRGTDRVIHKKTIVKE